PRPSLFPYTTLFRSTFVGDPPAGGRVDIKYRNAHQLTHGRNAQYTHFTLVTAAPETDVVIQFARFYMVLLFGVFGGCGKGLAAHYGRTQAGRTNQCCTGTGQSTGTEESAAA